MYLYATSIAPRLKYFISILMSSTSNSASLSLLIHIIRFTTFPINEMFGCSEEWPVLSRRRSPAFRPSTTLVSHLQTLHHPRPYRVQTLTPLLQRPLGYKPSLLSFKGPQGTNPHSSPSRPLGYKPSLLSFKALRYKPSLLSFKALRIQSLAPVLPDWSLTFKPSLLQGP